MKKYIPPHKRRKPNESDRPHEKPQQKSRRRGERLNTPGRVYGDIFIWGSDCRPVKTKRLPERLPEKFAMLKRARAESRDILHLKSSTNGYIPPHLRAKKPEDDILDAENERSSSAADSGSALSESHEERERPVVSSGGLEERPVINTQTGEAIVRKNNSVLEHYEDEENWEEPLEWRKVCEYYCKHSEYFRTLQNLKKEGRNNEHVRLFFAAKENNQNNSRSRVENTKVLFNRFYRYAVDIDLGCHFCKDMVDRRGELFLEFGFAPGGMSKLLLDAHPRIRGVGVTLHPSEGGNVHPADFDVHPRFQAHQYDVIKLALGSDDEIEKSLNFSQNTSFDLSIIGITIHQKFHEFDHLDHQVAYAQLYLTLLYLKDGGSLLIRHKMGLSLIHTHMMILFLKCFRSTPNFTKPLTEFAIRKTYWVLWKDFNREKMLKMKILEKLRLLLVNTVEGRKSGYDYDQEQLAYYNPILHEESIFDIIEEWGPKLVRLQSPMWEIQAEALDAYFKGQKDKICHNARRCSGRHCTAAHCRGDMIQSVLNQMYAVDKRIDEEQLKCARSKESEEDRLGDAGDFRSFRKKDRGFKQSSHRNSYFRSKS